MSLQRLKSKVIARVKATEYESHDLNSNLKDDYLVGSAPTIPKIFDACTPASKSEDGGVVCGVASLIFKSLYFNKFWSF